MKKEGYSWSLMIDWILDNFVFRDFFVGQTELPPVESTDGKEPTYESLKEEARQADAKRLVDPPRKPLRDSKVLDKEFWETQL